MEDVLLKLHIAALVKALRENYGWTQAELAERAGIHQVMISRVENEKVLASTLTCYSIAKAFGMTLGQFFSHEIVSRETIKRSGGVK